jgi:putative nucleotidyltransferase with HDIG domain
VVGSSAAELAKIVAEKLNGYFVMLDEEYDIARVVMPDKVNCLDFAACYGNDIYEDLARRDFTINALAVSLDGFRLIDPFNGIDDIKKGIVKVISEKNIIDDPLRILRAFRMSAKTGFEIGKETLEITERHVKLIHKSAYERINAELVKLFEGDFTAQNLVLMKNTGLLFEIFPELLPQLKVPPNLHHHLCLIDHSIESVRQFENVYTSLPFWVKEYLNEENSIKHIVLVKIALLLHDLGKPSTWQIDEEGRHRFIKHDEVGADIACEVLKRLKFSKNTVKYISKLVRFHIYPSQLIRSGESATEKAILRMFRKLGTETPAVIVLAMADRLSARGVEITEEKITQNLEGLRFFLEEYFKNKEKTDTLPKLLSGNDIMGILGIAQGKEVGKILGALKEAQIAGDINTQEEAAAFVKAFEYR